MLDAEANLAIGTMVVDPRHDVWDDWNDKCSLREDYEDEYPEGFIWSCCDGQGDVKVGCKTRKHKEEEVGSKKNRNGV